MIVLQKLHSAVVVARSVGYVLMRRGYNALLLSNDDAAQYDICTVSIASMPRSVPVACATSLSAGPTTMSGFMGVNNRCVSSPIVKALVEPVSITDTEICTPHELIDAFAN